MLQGLLLLVIERKQITAVCFYSHFGVQSLVKFLLQETRKTVNTRNISGMLLCCKEKANQAGEN